MSICPQTVQDSWVEIVWDSNVQRAAHARQIYYSIHAETFSSTPKLSKQKKGSTGRVGRTNLKTCEPQLTVFQMFSVFILIKYV